MADVTTQSTLHFDILLDKDKMPETISWQSVQGAGHTHSDNCKAMLVSLWDGKTQESLKIDLWTNDMQVDEMFKLYYQTFHAMADTLKRATGNEEAALNIKAFADMFGENTDVVKKAETI